MQALLIESAVRATLLITTAALLLWAMRIRTASVLHAAWASVIVGMLLLPLLVAWGPRLSLRVLAGEAPAFPPPVLVEMNAEASPAPDPSSTPAVQEAVVQVIRLPWQAAAIGVYLLGLGFFLTRLAIGTLQVRRLLRSAELDRGKLVHSACSTPITVGWLRPTVILPSDWSQWPQGQIDAVMAHEAEHIRRRDPLFQWLALLNRAVFWFHPLLWWLERKLAALAEEACDAAVLSRGHDPGEYSRYLLAMARLAQQSGARVHALGMAMPGVGLRERIRTILDGVRTAPVSRTRLACIAILLSAAGVTFTTSNLAHAQQPLPSFEVATIKPSGSTTPGGFITIPSAGHIRIPNMSLLDLIRFAYGEGVGGLSLQVTGGPNWMDRERYNVEGKAPGDSATLTDYRLMLRALLVERFALKIHTESKPADIYALVLARSDGKLGPKVQPNTGDECRAARRIREQTPPDQPPPPPRTTDPKGKGPRCLAQGLPTGMRFEGVTMAVVADMLASPMANLGRPVLDRTGLSGEFNIEFEFPFGPPPGLGERAPADPLAPSLFAALQEQLGLKLESAKGTVEVLVVDQAQHPTEN